LAHRPTPASSPHVANASHGPRPSSAVEIGRVIRKANSKSKLPMSSASPYPPRLAVVYRVTFTVGTARSNPARTPVR
jgi:hypothetical protein